MSSRMAIGLAALVLLIGANSFLMKKYVFVVKSAE